MQLTELSWKVDRHSKTKMKPIKTQIEELEKGCGKVFQQYGITKCGEKHGVIILCCETCRAKLQTLKECQKMFEDYNEKLKEDCKKRHLFKDVKCENCKAIDKLSKEVLGK